MLGLFKNGPPCKVYASHGCYMLVFDWPGTHGKGHRCVTILVTRYVHCIVIIIAIPVIDSMCSCYTLEVLELYLLFHTFFCCNIKDFSAATVVLTL